MIGASLKPNYHFVNCGFRFGPRAVVYLLNVRQTRRYR